jgi:hypothetical protein
LAFASQARNLLETCGVFLRQRQPRTRAAGNRKTQDFSRERIRLRFQTWVRRSATGGPVEREKTRKRMKKRRCFARKRQQSLPWNAGSDGAAFADLRIVSVTNRFYLRLPHGLRKAFGLGPGALY